VPTDALSVVVHSAAISANQRSPSVEFSLIRRRAPERSGAVHGIRMAVETPRSRIVHRVRSWPRRTVITIAIIALVLIAARIALPYIVKSKVNQRLASIPGYAGQVGDIGIALIRGAYTLDGVAIYKIDGAAREPFFLAKYIDFSVAWRELIHGKVVSDIHVDEMKLNFVAAGPEKSQKDIDRRWQEVVKDLFPLEITHLEITKGEVRYKDMTRRPEVDLFVENMQLVATGLRNRAGERGGEFPAEITLHGDTLGGGNVNLFVAAEPLAAQPHFHLSAKLENVNLPDLNESLKAYANVDVGRGTFQMAAEMAGKDGGFQGYIKPFFENLDFNNLEDKKKNVFTRVWENIVGGLAWLVKNKPRDQVGTRIPFQGRFGDPKVGLWATISNLFRHGFIRAFNPTVEGSVNPDNVLPSGDSADGKKVADKKEDRPAPDATPSEKGAGKPTGRPSERKLK
jgi:hypothetical protein